MRIAFINVTASLSTGRIASEQCRTASLHGHRTLLCYAREFAPVDIATLKIGNKCDVNIHGVKARITDKVGFYSKWQTKKFLKKLDKFNPDLIHLHNLHGYYINLPLLFQYIREKDIPIVWTLHDSFAYTGHCCYYAHVQFKDRDPTELGCYRWMTGCRNCPEKLSYPASFVFDNSKKNWINKKKLFTNIPNMILTTPSKWLQNEVQNSFLKEYPVYALPNGVDLNKFKPCNDTYFLSKLLNDYRINSDSINHLIISVAAVWDDRKGIEDFYELSSKLPEDYTIILIGLAKNQIDVLPTNSRVIGIERINHLPTLCGLYTLADLYVSFSRGETMGMTLVESLACGVQVLCYDSCAMPEIINDKVGKVVPLFDVDAAKDAVIELCENPKNRKDCIEHAKQYEASMCYERFVTLYENMFWNAKKKKVKQEDQETEENKKFLIKKFVDKFKQKDII